MATTSVRIDRNTHQRLKTIAEREHKPIGDVIDQMVESYERKEFREAVAKSFIELRADPETYDSYKQELRSWDVTLQDGLKKEPPYPEGSFSDE